MLFASIDKGDQFWFPFLLQYEQVVRTIFVECLSLRRDVCMGDGKARNPAMGTLYVVATPIGNREDITLRALQVLRDVAVVAAEDTRHTGQLLTYYGIEAHYLSLHAHNEAERIERIVARLEAGDDVALVSDAGTPAVSDPGALLVQAVAAAGYAVVPVPGASALTAAVSAAGLIAGPFTFLGFLPAKQSARRAALEAVRAVPHPLVCYEAPHRLDDLLADALLILGDRPAVLCRELTKMHEEIVRGTIASIAVQVRTRGECVVIFDGSPPQTPVVSDDATLDVVLDTLLASGLSPAAVAKEAAKQTGRDRADCYTRAVQRKTATR